MRHAIATLMLLSSSSSSPSSLASLGLVWWRGVCRAGSPIGGAETVPIDRAIDVRINSLPPAPASPIPRAHRHLNEKGE